MIKKNSSLTSKLRQNWWVDAILALGALVAIVSSLYFLAFPIGGYQVGRNFYYDFTVIFSRQTWDIIHTWSGVAMVMAALIHILMHWGWIKGTINRTWQVIRSKREGFGSRLTYNILLDAIIAVSFLICAISGVYFMFFAQSGPSSDVILFSKSTWDLIHTWSGVTMTITAILHFVLHWKWVTNITKKMFAQSKKRIKNRQSSIGLEQA